MQPHETLPPSTSPDTLSLAEQCNPLLRLDALSGRFFVFEGIDGSGKSTQCALLATALRTQGYDVLETREPTDGVWGKRLRSLARQGIRLPAQEELQLFIQDRKEHIASLILPKLRTGAIILQDRYFPSSMAYQGSRDLPLSAILEAHYGWAPLPHCFLFLHLQPEQALQRIKARAQQIDAFERLESLQRCDAIFEQLADLPSWHRFDALCDPQSLHQAILAAITPHLPR